MEKEQKLMLRMMAYESGVPGRIQHFIKVYTLAKTIGEGEKLPEDTMEILRTAALVHDIGIKPSLEKYGSDAGEYQEKEGPAVAEKMLAELGYSESVISRVSYLVGHHHTYTSIDGADYQILVEADFLVNLFEGEKSQDAVRSAYRKIFRTETGREICRLMFGLAKEQEENL